ncbi:branched-chain amino acid ABC transporter permease [Bradyrhizobium sp. ISRA443]|uniref:branched-chain amino acid ABC transporter permease n=1 Tax=unclassified Bradyrhizobium TaxID=2631580 RepID=UPI0024790C7D|nr:MULTISPECIES: branched-chain amino acid ABC transporter permease [unclassified Bradyrhizobium]WGR97493.1 branched-chain amino acid ABC transporter permease [Bradyrhizobium sp. ISRA436]WGS04383.1 branched-chain amino acid ABC transporter permease [Bradyrhizobium sp. ISRA437]WGS11265.1 branched-chain amino acid ABC transporter permease [Bradyrhizobium sp. ISRA443]
MATAPAWASTYGLLALRDAVIFAVFALSYDLLWGKARTLTLGHGAFFGLGAYGLAITNTAFGIGSAGGIVAGILFAAALAAVVGYFLIFAGVRLHFLAIITIAVLLIVGQVINSWSALTGGDVGILGIPGLRFSIMGVDADLSGETASYYFALTFLVVALLSVWALCRGNYGMILNAIGMNEFRARALGYNTSLYILIVFVGSAALAGMSGAIFAATTGVVAPDLFSPLLSTQVILWVAIGGRGTLIGPVFATIALSRLQQEISSYSTSLWPFIAGVLFLALVLGAPEGLPGLVARFRRTSRANNVKLEVRHE